VAPIYPYRDAHNGAVNRVMVHRAAANRVERRLRPVPFGRFRKDHVKEPLVAVDDPRFAGWETVSSFEDQNTAVAWRDQLRGFGLDASCVADHPLDRFGRGDIYLVVPESQWSRANEIIENLDDD
jgi:hypothetical protein